MSGDPGNLCNGTGTPLAKGFDNTSTTGRTPGESGFASGQPFQYVERNCGTAGKTRQRIFRIGAPAGKSLFDNRLLYIFS
jgi:hypothetical protein